MINLSIPNFENENLQLENLVLDFNGTLAINGRLILGVKERLNSLSEKLKIHVITGNTFGTAEEELAGINCELILLSQKNQRHEKENYINSLSKGKTVSIGNGRNDKEMLESSIIGIILLQTEGMAVESLISADIVCENILDALDLLREPNRLIATLRG